MTDGSYKQFCPVAMAAEILCSRWTVVILRELVIGSTRFNELRRGIPRISPALLSKRLKDLETAGVITRQPVSDGSDMFEYILTPAGLELRPVIESIGIWGHRWIETDATLSNLDPKLLMWDMRRNIDPKPLPPRKCTLQIIYSDLPRARRNWWLIITPDGAVDLCSIDPGFDVDLYLQSDLRTMTEVWMGYTSIDKARESGKLLVTGDRQIEANLQSWFGLSIFAKVERLVA